MITILYSLDYLILTTTLPSTMVSTLLLALSQQSSGVGMTFISHVTSPGLWAGKMPKVAQPESGRTSIHSNWPEVPSQCLSDRITPSWKEAVTRAFSGFSWLKADDSIPSMPVLSFYLLSLWSPLQASWHTLSSVWIPHTTVTLHSHTGSESQKCWDVPDTPLRTHCPAGQGFSDVTQIAPARELPETHVKVLILGSWPHDLLSQPLGQQCLGSCIFTSSIGGLCHLNWEFLNCGFTEIESVESPCKSWKNILPNTMCSCTPQGYIFALGTIFQKISPPNPISPCRGIRESH